MKDIKTISRVKITHGPTPFEAMVGLSLTLGYNLFIKRDDCTGLAGGGNKTRKLEYLIAAAQDAGADTLVTIGGLQSNHARQTAAAAAKFGFACELVLEDVEGTPKEDYYDNGNLLLDKLFGATIHLVGEGEDSQAFSQQLISVLAEEGKKPYFIPVGGSNEIGCLGYMRCANEILEQAAKDGIELAQIVLASGSAGTQAGLIAGLIAAQSSIPVLGISISRDVDAQHALVQDLLEKTLDFMGLDPHLAQGKVNVRGEYYGDGYGIATPASIEAINLCAQREGVLLDPVYTGKGMSGLIDMCKKEEYARGSNILFLHTGGSQALFAYREVLI